MNDIQSYAGKMMWVILAILLIYEVWALFNNKSGDTISAAVWHAVLYSPATAFAGGMLAGHFFLNMGIPARICFFMGLFGGWAVWKPGINKHL